MLHAKPILKIRIDKWTCDLANSHWSHCGQVYGSNLSVAPSKPTQSKILNCSQVWSGHTDPDNNDAFAPENMDYAYKYDIYTCR